ncbi:SPX domain-containing protein [Lipomyces doorenjongii]|uniref:SPX domain-containing protein n=1 Tax=Lipomyces doorenjongii TaxID=383834 RepID=UPI0034CE72FC
MKFAKVFQQLLDEENIPKEWVGTAIQYKSLKKCINKVVEELEELGLEKETLQLLLAYEKAQRNHAQSSGVSGKGRPKLIYSFEGTLHEFVPKITINLDNVNGMPLSAAISPETRAKLASLASDVSRRSSHISAVRDDSDSINSIPNSPEERDIYISDREDVQTDGCDGGDTITIAGSTSTANEPMTTHKSETPRQKGPQYGLRNLFKPEYNVMQFAGSKGVGSSSDDVRDAADGPEAPLGGIPRTIEIHLHSDSEFFKMLCSELVALDSLHEEQEKELTEQVTDIARRLPHAASPLQKKNDLYVWREIFRLYIDAGVFFSSLEQDHGERSVEKAKQQLTWFTDQIQQMDLMDRFKSPESKSILESFWKLNVSLLQSAQFQALNRTATTKILKKFDKQTALTAREVFPEFYFNNPSGSVSMSVAKSVCFTMAEQLLTVIPQLDDYICPVCYLIAFKPVRLDCGHVFCIRCLVKLQRQQMDGCPICRQNVLMNANGRNMDIGLHNQMLLYFPKETKEKQSANDKEVTKEQLQFNNAKQCLIQ